MIDPTRQPGILIDQILLERAHFEHRSDFLDFPAQTAVNVDIDFNLSSALTSDGTKALVRLTVSSKEEPEPLYKLALTLTALVSVETGKENFPLNEYVTTNAWAMLFPFIRETVANITARGRFGAMWLKPINLVALANTSGQSPAPKA